MSTAQKLNTNFDLTKSIVKILLIALATVLAFVIFMQFTPTVAHAANDPATPAPQYNTNNRVINSPGNGGKAINVCGVISTCPTWIEGFRNTSSSPDSLAKSIFKFILMFVYIAIYLSAAVAVVFIVISGYRYITSQGDEKNTKPALETLKNAVIGFVLAVVSVTIVTFIGNFLTTFNF
jgi:flagellar basal body-associated protein FliL